MTQRLVSGLQLVCLAAGEVVSDGARIAMYEPQFPIDSKALFPPAAGSLYIACARAEHSLLVNCPSP